MYLKGIQNRERNCSGKQNSFDGPNIKGKMFKKGRNLKQHKCSKCLRVARESRGARSVSVFVPCTGCNFASWFSFNLELQQTNSSLSLHSQLGFACIKSIFLFFFKTKQFLFWLTKRVKKWRYASVQEACRPVAASGSVCKKAADFPVRRAG